MVFVRVNESVHAPHTIENSTRVYIRTGSVSQPYKLSDMDRIAYMFKRREHAEVASRTILNRIEATAESKIGLDTERQLQVTVVIRPVFPYRLVIELSTIYELFRVFNFARRVSGGVAFILKASENTDYTEMNEYGIVFHRVMLHHLSLPFNEQKLEYESIFVNFTEQLIHASRLYQECSYLGNIEVSVVLKGIAGGHLHLPQSARISSLFRIRMCSTGDEVFTPMYRTGFTE